MDDLLEQFLIERRELIEQAADDLLALEARPRDRALIDGAFRAIHTLKGSTGLFDLAPVTAVLHAAEDLLSLLRDDRAEASAGVIETLLAVVNQVDRWIDDFEASGALPSDVERTSRELRARLAGAVGADATGGSQSTIAARDMAWAVPLAALAPPDARTAVLYTPSPDCFFRGDDPLAIVGGVPGLLQLNLAPREPWGDPALFDPFRCNLVLTLLSSAPMNEVETALRLVFDQVEVADLAAAAQPDLADAARPIQGGGDRTVRIDAARLDALAELVDELMVAKNAAAHLAAQAEAGLDLQALRRGLAAHAANFDRLSGRLHRTVMRARMAPLTGLWRRFPRLVREIAATQDKNVDFQLAGESVEVDKSLLDGLFEPLIHLVRNALDHGVEPPAQREAAGKPARATLTLSARQLGDQVVIEVADDGRGVDPAAVRRTALARGLMDEASLSALSDAGTIDLIFLSGFSTARDVSDLSGRGVGMDAVRSSVARMGGSLAIDSAPGRGTRVALSLPLAMVLTRVMVVTAGGERFGIPMDEVSETARIERDRIAAVREGRAFVLRDRTVPLFDLAALTGGSALADDGADLTVLVVRHGDALAAVSVDGVVDRVDVVMRPLSGLMSHMRGVSGATLMGDGEVLMLLDLEGMIG